MQRGFELQVCNSVTDGEYPLQLVDCIVSFHQIKARRDIEILCYILHLYLQREEKNMIFV